MWVQHGTCRTVLDCLHGAGGAIVGCRCCRRQHAWLQKWLWLQHQWLQQGGWMPCRLLVLLLVHLLILRLG